MEERERGARKCVVYPGDQIGRGGGGGGRKGKKKKEKWSRANAEPLHHRGRHGNDNRKVVSFQPREKKIRNFGHC